MGLYEIWSGWTGEAFERVYAWASCETEAIAMAMEKFKLAHPRREIKAQARLKFTDNSPPFCSEVSDSGFELSDDVD